MNRLSSRAYSIIGGFIPEIVADFDLAAKYDNPSRGQADEVFCVILTLGENGVR